MYPSLSALGEDLNADDPSLIMPQFMVDHFLRDDDINPYTGYSRSFEKSLSPTSLKLYEAFESASQNFEALKSEGKLDSWAKFKLVSAERAFHQDYIKNYLKEASLGFYRAVKDGVVDTAEWAVENPLSAAYATGEMALSTAGAVMTGGRNVYEVAFHGKQLKSAAFETAVAFAVTKGAIKAYKGVSRLVARGVSVKKLSLVGGKGVSNAYQGFSATRPIFLPKGITHDKIKLNQHGQWVLDSTKFASSKEYWQASNSIVKDGKLFQEHHIISDKFRKTADHDLWKASGLDPNVELNKMLMPTQQGAQFGTNMRSIHQGKHLGEVNKSLAEKMSAELDLGRLEGWKQEQYAQALKGIIREERIELTLGNRMLNKNARPHAKPLNLDK